MKVRQFYKKVLFAMIFLVICLFFLISLVRHIYSEESYSVDFIRPSVSFKEPTKDHIDGVIEDTSKRKAENQKLPNIKYILQWTPSNRVPFEDMGEGHQGFIDRKCAYTNCFVTNNRTFLGDHKNFDVIAFNGPQVIHLQMNGLPKGRHPHQKYVFGNIESADNYPVCSNRFDGLFNWTWTYKLSSEVQWGYVVVRNISGVKIGPKENMHWIKLEDMDPVSDFLKEELKTKSKAVAWLVSNCYARNRRDVIAKKLQSELKKYDLTVDIFGKCGNKKCANNEECWKLIERDYYFYLAFENSFAEDYVTEKLLHALEHNAIPVVYGGANYTRFMPDGIYLNANEMEVEKLAAKISELIRNPDQYYEYFKWKNHYYYHGTTKTVESNEYCRFCELLNNEEEVKKVTIYENFREFWDPPGRC